MFLGYDLLIQPLLRLLSSTCSDRLLDQLSSPCINSNIYEIINPVVLQYIIVFTKCNLSLNMGRSKGKAGIDLVAKCFFNTLMVVV